MVERALSALKASFDARVDSSGEHWIWLGARDPVRGTGRAKLRGRDVTAHRMAWELEKGPVPDGGRVLACPVEAACVRVEHLRVDGGAVERMAVPAAPVRRRRKGAGSMVEVRDGVFRLTVTAGTHPDGRQRRSARTVAATRTQAAKLLADLVSEVGDGSAIARPESKDVTVDAILGMYLAACSEESEDNPKVLAHSTMVRYEELRKKWISPSVGTVRVRLLGVDEIDRLFAMMRKDGKSHSHMNQTKSLLNGALRWAKRRRVIDRNPMVGFELPRSKYVSREVIPPEVDELIGLLNGANEHDRDLAPVLALAATTGMRRGELAGLRRDRLDLDGGGLRVDNAVNDAGGEVVEKGTKTHQVRWVRLDPATIAMLRAHLKAMDARAAACGVTLETSCFVFSLAPDCSLPMRPELMTRKMRILRGRLGLTNVGWDASILALRKFTTTELMDAGFNPSAISGRQGHTVQVMLAHYSKRRASADQAAADHLGQRLYGPAATKDAATVT